jgi:hypothetical protein
MGIKGCTRADTRSSIAINFAINGDYDPTYPKLKTFNDDDLGDKGAVPVTRGDNTVLPQTPGSRRNET